MSASLVDDLMRQLQGAPTGQIAQQLGTDPNTAASAIEAALPMLLGALGRNTQQPGGAADLFGALQRDHGGGGAGAMDLGGLLGGLLGGGAGNAGAPAARWTLAASSATSSAASSRAPKAAWARSRA